MGNESAAGAWVEGQKESLFDAFRIVSNSTTWHPHPQYCSLVSFRFTPPI
jgi:hypothetical protein